MLTTATGALCGLFDELPDVQAWIKDARRRYFWVNRAFLLNYGLHELSEVLGKTDDDLSPPHLATHFREGDEAVLAGQTVQGRLELVGRFDHTASWCFTTKRPVFDTKGRAIGTAGITRVLDAAQIDQREDIRLGVVISMMTQRLGKAVTNAEMAKAAGMSSRAFERAFLREYGLPPRQYLKRLRIQTACRLLVDTRESIASIAQRCGFADQSHFTREFRRVTGTTPAAYRAEYAAANVPSAAVSVLSTKKRKR
ncbi:MAG: helix-turn-helix domain-containing protein [Verrucomicrobiaceae bacterium]|jgi:AraC-like DNA-binding protein|nr:helix-turn-helix domain-containing protein [Verrucomicrobiaceae bacterium]